MQVCVTDSNVSTKMLPAVAGTAVVASTVDNKFKIAEDIKNIIKKSVEISSVNVANDDNKKNRIKENNLKGTLSKTNQSNQLTESCHNPVYAHTPFPGISQLLPTLFLSGAGAAMPQVLDKLGVSFIVNVAPELPDTPLSSVTKPLYLRISEYDRPGVNLAAHFDEVADMIEEVRQHGGKALVHCVAGVSRSTTLCLAYLMKYAGMNLREAYLHVKAIRQQIRPNSGFFQQLRQYEEKLRGCSSSVKMVYYESLNKEIPDVYEPEYKAMEDFYQRQRNALKRC